MIWITTPFLVALQYFSADQPIFTSFDRSPRNFVISLCILALAFPLLVWGFNNLHCLVVSVIRRLSGKKSRDEEDPEGARHISFCPGNSILLTEHSEFGASERNTGHPKHLVWLC